MSPQPEPPFSLSPQPEPPVSLSPQPEPPFSLSPQPGRMAVGHHLRAPVQAWTGVSLGLRCGGGVGEVCTHLGSASSSSVSASRHVPPAVDNCRAT
eukprot:6438678-Prymnesium_polylepis.1